MTYELSVAGLKRDLVLCPLNPELYIGAFILFGDVELTERCAEELCKRAPSHDIIITVESKGIPLVHAMCKIMGENKYLLARKAKKFYMHNVLSTNTQSITTAGIQTLHINGEDAELMRGKRVLIVDDVVSTGGSLKSVEELVKLAGGEIVGKMTILAEGDAAKRDDVIYLEKLPLFDKNGKPIC